MNITIPVEEEKVGTISDGYHTFDELYEHRITLYIALCKLYQGVAPTSIEKPVFRTKVHPDGSSWDGWFLLGLGRIPGKQISYHLPISRWDECDFANTLDIGPEFDGHTPADVLARIAAL